MTQDVPLQPEDPRLDAALVAAAAAGGDTIIPLDEDLYTADGVPLQCAGSLRQITTAVLAAADAVFSSDTNMEYLAVMLAGFKHPDREWEDLTEDSRRIARDSARVLMDALKLPQRVASKRKAQIGCGQCSYCAPAPSDITHFHRWAPRTCERQPQHSE